MARARRARSPATKKPSAKTQNDSSTTTGVSSSSTKQCKGCGSGTRKLTAPGPRCATCHRDRRTASQLARRLSYVARQYGLTPEQYQALVDHCRKNDKGQALCMMCNRVRARAVDHDHSCCSGKTSCGKCVRGLLCTRCNVFLGHSRDDVAVAHNMVDYLTNPPALTILKEKHDGLQADSVDG